MKLGFSILSYLPPDAVFLQLLKQIGTWPGASMAIHHDSYQTPIPTVFSQLGALLTNKVYRTYWSHLNNVLATVETLKTLMNQAEKPDWVFTLTPNDLPIKGHNYITNELTNTNANALVDFREVNIANPATDLDTWLATELEHPIQFKMPFVSKKGTLYSRPVRRPVRRKHPFDNDLPFCHGSNWFTLRADVVDWLLDQNIEAHPATQFYKRFAHKTEMHPCPQEVILQSILNKCPFIKKTGNTRRFIDWEGGANYHPANLNLLHLDAINQSDAFFARKFVVGHSDALINKIK